jgi:hypothetical protein
MERLKYLSSDAQTLFTFEGYGPYGTSVRERNERLSVSGFGAEYLGQDMGFGKHRLGDGRLACYDDLTPLLAHIARYCAWRGREFAVKNVKSKQLAGVTATNLTRELGRIPAGFHLTLERPAICDNRMAPQYWLLTGGGQWRKLDAAIHGDDHFVPGPCDIAWDLAGVAVEWELSPNPRDYLLREYRRFSGDDVTTRIRNYEIAYAMFRLAWSRMAVASVGGSDEEPRVARDILRYRRALARFVTSDYEVTGATLSLPVSA